MLNEEQISTDYTDIFKYVVYKGLYPPYNLR